jgi:alpha-1,2-mannosyltransferase
MYTTTLACAYAFETCSSSNYRRTLLSTLLFAVGGIVGWPFALAVAIPFIYEELFVSGTDIVMSHTRTSWMLGRFRRLIITGLTSALILVRFHLFSTQTSVEPFFTDSSHLHRYPCIRQTCHRPVAHR